MWTPVQSRPETMFTWWTTRVRVYVLNREGHMALTYASDLQAEDLAADLKRLARQ